MVVVEKQDKKYIHVWSEIRKTESLYRTHTTCTILFKLYITCNKQNTHLKRQKSNPKSCRMVQSKATMKGKELIGKLFKKCLHFPFSRGMYQNIKSWFPPTLLLERYSPSNHHQNIHTIFKKLKRICKSFLKKSSIRLNTACTMHILHTL